MFGDMSSILPSETACIPLIVYAILYLQNLAPLEASSTRRIRFPLKPFVAPQ